MEADIWMELGLNVPDMPAASSFSCPDASDCQKSSRNYAPAGQIGGSGADRPNNANSDRRNSPAVYAKWVGVFGAILPLIRHSRRSTAGNISPASRSNAISFDDHSNPAVGEIDGMYIHAKCHRCFLFPCILGSYPGPGSFPFRSSVRSGQGISRKIVIDHPDRPVIRDKPLPKLLTFLECHRNFPILARQKPTRAPEPA